MGGSSTFLPLTVSTGPFLLTIFPGQAPDAPTPDNNPRLASSTKAFPIKNTLSLYGYNCNLL